MMMLSLFAGKLSENLLAERRHIACAHGDEQVALFELRGDQRRRRFLAWLV